MKIFGLIAREKRLLALCAASALLHAAVLLFGRVDLRGSPAAPAALSVRLQAAPAPSPPAPHAPPPPIRSTGSAPAPITPAPAAAPSAAGWSAVPDNDDSAAQHVPGRQAVQLPPSALLAYAVTRSAPGQAPAAAGAAQLEWRVTQSDYQMSMQGVTGTLQSRGQLTDAGFAPLEAREISGSGGTDAVTAFDWAKSQVRFARGAGNLAGDGQDRASVLMLLSGIGLAEPMQVKDVMEFFVAGSGAAGTVRFQVVGPENLDTPLGEIASVHLMQLVQPGQARLDVWLAPGHSWYPVQLRVSAPDGSASTQSITSITPLR
ncbi:DUF3108 domain-containing protein [Massilia sp. R2A-15]|uniref:DUF3108 domain-containing protein n=1 Tax=Massilia sp. R2A-15 TaxID=3064278 RepID=UPI002733107B|nr:DUF3108 domain-containing protein [Massilia sp. R2A-15]WLI91488.1 DUF3108 domain-containing protein [Massilia sp. R2A-15]